jgi:hypothetical protein
MDVVITVGKVRASNAGKRLGAPKCVGHLFSNKMLIEN